MARIFSEIRYAYAPSMSVAPDDSERAGRANVQVHEREVLLLLNVADLTLCEIFTNDEQLARQLELQGCARDIPLFEETDLRAALGKRLPHLFVVASDQIVLSALRPVF